MSLSHNRKLPQMTSNKLLYIWKIRRTFTYNIFEGQKYNLVEKAMSYVAPHYGLETLHIKYEDLQIKKDNYQRSIFVF